MGKKKWDVFISHASEDKVEIADKIAELLEYFGIKVWYDKNILSVGDDISKSIDIGLVNSRYGIIILSENFFRKGWTEYEFRSLLNREIGMKKVILPIWHKVDIETIKKYSPFLLGKYALDTTKQKIEQIVLELIRVIKPTVYKNITRELLWRKFKSNAKTKYINRSEIKISEIRHNELPKNLLLRIENLYYSIAKYIKTDLNDFIDRFKRDLHPTDEIVVWEFINLCFQKYVTENNDTQDNKETIEQLIMISLGILEKNNNISDDKYLKILKIWSSNFPLFHNKSKISK